MAGGDAVRATGGVPRVYAEAIFRIAKERGEIDAVLEDLRAVDAAFRANPKFHALVESPSVGAAEAERAVRGAFADAVSDPVLNLLLLLVRKRRQKAFAKVVEAYEAMVTEEHHERRVAVATAGPLDDAARTRLAEVLSRKLGARVVLETRVDPALLGGVLVRVGDTLIDGSLKAGLARLSRDMTNGTNEKGQRS
jgi:F-type H+-transporting ATPase subunit delta